MSDGSGSSWFHAGNRSDSCNDYCDSEPRDPVHDCPVTRYEPVETEYCHSPERDQGHSTTNSATVCELFERASGRTLIRVHELSSERESELLGPIETLETIASGMGLRDRRRLVRE